MPLHPVGFWGKQKVQINTNGRANTRVDLDCYSGVQFSSSGTENEYANNGTTTSIGTWLNSGSAGDYWILCTLISGTWNSINAGTGTRLQMSTTRSWRNIQTTTGTNTVVARFRIYDAAVGGSLLADTGNITFSATRESGA